MLIRKFEIKKYIKEKYTTDPELKKYWEKISSEGREKLVNGMTEMFYEETQNIDLLLKKRADWINNAILFLSGILLGVFGGLISNILHTVLLKHGRVYYLTVFIVFGIITVALYIFIRERYNPMRNKTWKGFVDHMIEKYKEETNKG